MCREIYDMAEVLNASQMQAVNLKLLEECCNI